MHMHTHHHAPDDDDGAPETTDAASRSLADALRVSFRVLTVIMVIVAGLFVFSSVASVEPYERGIKRVFGEIVGEEGEGLVYTWPFPIGRVDTVSTKNRTVVIEEFWFDEKPEDKTLPLDKRRVRNQGLRPIWDGALVTGDRNLLHVRPTCIYRVSRPTQYVTNLADPEFTIRSVVCGASIRAAATATADRLVRGGLGEFTERVRELAQRRLDALDAGVTILSITVGGGDATWPLRARPEFDAVARASQTKEEQISKAKGEAQGILRTAAGTAAARVLVGTLDQVRDGFARSARQREHKLAELQAARAAGDEEAAGRLQAELDELGENLIGQYASVREDIERGRLEDGTEVDRPALEQKAEALLAQIDKVLTSNLVEGEASRVISEAAGYATITGQRVEGWNKQFRKLLPYCDTPVAMAFQFERQWAEIREEILASPLVEKYFLPPGQRRIVLRISADPAIRRAIQLEGARLTEEERLRGSSQR